MALSPNTHLGRYEIRSLLGEGGMGEVYLARDPKDGRAKILDFGLAKLTQGDGRQSQTEIPTRRLDTDPGAVMGTVGYMAPEQVRGQKVDHRADIFSFGAVLYEMLTGRRAFRGDSAVETMNAILKEDPK